MTIGLLGLLGVILFLCIVLWASRALMAAFGVGDPTRTVLYVVLVLICLAWVLPYLGVPLPFRLR